MKRLLFSFFLTGIVILFISSCDNNKVFYDYKSIPMSGWEKDSAVTFSFDITSTVQRYNLYLNVRNRTSYNYRNLWLFVETIEPNGASKKDTVEITIASLSGEWTGKGFGEFKTLESIFRRDVTFGTTGIYTINIQHGMRENNLKGISDIGFMLEKIE